MLCDPVDPPCEDAQFLQLALQEAPSPREVRNTVHADHIETYVDATAGVPAGSIDAPSESFVYARFSPDGLVKVEISDEDAFFSQEWDIAFRRYIIRLNSGVSGPSCVTASRTARDTDFAALDAVPAGTNFLAEQYMTDTCDIIPDGSGLPSPGTILASYWNYEGCLRMTGNVYLIALADGRYVKLVVDSYYLPENQRRCDEMGSAGQPSNAGNVNLRWAFVGE